MENESSLTYLLDVVADDFGYCPERNRSILECFQHGIVTRSSMLVAFPAATQGAQAAGAVGLPLGLHFNLTELTTVLPVDEVPSLYQPLAASSPAAPVEPRCLYDKHSFRTAFLSGLICPEHVVKELVAQMHRFHQLTGYYPRHIDGHQHIHCIPGVARLIRSTLQLHFAGVIEAFRLPYMASAASLRHRSQGDAFRSDVAADSLIIRSDILAAFPQSPRYFVGLTTMGEKISPETFIAILRQEFEANPVVSAEKMSDKTVVHVEWMVHPSYRSLEPHSDEFSRSEERSHEHRLLSEDVASWLTCFNDHQIKLNRSNLISID